MSTYGRQSIAKSGSGYRVLQVPASARFKVGGATIDWETVLPVGGKNEKVTIQITGSPTGGTFTISYGGQTTGNIAYNASADTVEAALEGLSTIGNGNIKVSLSGSTYTLEGVESLGKKNLTAFTTTNSFTGGTSPNTTITVTQQGEVLGDYTLQDGTVVAGGDRVIEAGTVLVMITASGKFGPFDGAATDGRQTIDDSRLGEVFILDQTVIQSDAGSDHTGSLIDAGIVWKDRCKVGGSNQPTWSDIRTVCPGIQPGA